MIAFLRRWLIGHPLATAQAVHERLTKTVALAVFSSDALSSTAYTTAEILLVLAVAAAATASGSFFFVLPISLAIAVLLWIVGISYRQTIYAYPSGGGAYIMAKDNLGTVPGLTAGGGPGKSGAQRIGDGPPPLPQWDDPWCVQRDAPGLCCRGGSADGSASTRSTASSRNFTRSSGRGSMENILGEVREHTSTCPRWVGAYLRHALLPV
jgi:hypothetical protein